MNLTPHQFNALVTLHESRFGERMRNGLWLCGKTTIEDATMRALAARRLINVRVKNRHFKAWIARQADDYVEWQRTEMARNRALNQGRETEDEHA